MPAKLTGSKARRRTPSRGLPEGRSFGSTRDGRRSSPFPEEPTVLGIWDGHDGGVALIRGGELLFALSEERLARVKRASGFPHRALALALASTGTDAAEIDAVGAVGRYGRLLQRVGDRWYRSSSPARDPLGPLSVAVRRLETGLARAPGIRALEAAGSARVLSARLRGYGIDAPLTVIPHHDAHAHTAALGGLRGALLVTMDGYGDGLCGTFDALSAGREELPSPGFSAALVYGGTTRALGFAEGDEGKVMGLAAHGDPEPLRDFFRAVIDDARCRPGLGGRAARAALGAHPREDVAAALQARTEEVVCRWIRARRRGRSGLALAGGLFANVSLNGRLRADFDELFVFPHMGDGGLCVGAAVALAGPVPFGLPFLGPTYDGDAIDAALARAGLPSEPSQDPEGALLEVILAGGTAARFVGASEFGPRALGHRSILLRADRPALADALNARLGRDDFMPFAPVRREGDGSATMTVVVAADQTLRTRCPAAVHVDGTVRTQLASRAADPGLWSLLERAERRGLPALINTSFNRHGEPIVETPRHALDTFVAARLDVLQLGDRIVRRPR